MSESKVGTYIALLRAINVSGKNKLPMNDLRDLVTGLGALDVRTYIQSGNVVFDAAESLAERLPDLLRRAIEDRFGFRVPVLMPNAKELSLVATGNPLLKPDVDLRTLHVAFLPERPSAARVGALDPDRSLPDEFAVRGWEIYLRCPNGYGRTKLTNAYFDSKLAVTTTVRSWRTVLKLVEMASVKG